MEKEYCAKLMLSTSVLSLSLLCTPTPVCAEKLKDIHDHEVESSANINKSFCLTQANQGIIQALPGELTTLKPAPSTELVKLIKPRYRNELYSKVSELDKGVIDRALGYPEKQNPLQPTQLFGDVIRFHDSFDNGNTWRDVFADSGR